MNPEWMEWAAENMPADMLQQMISSRNWGLEWRNNQIAELLAKHNRLREALKEIRSLNSVNALILDIIETALQDDE